MKNMFSNQTGKYLPATILAIASSLMLSCSPKGSTFSIMAQNQNFSQSAATINNKIDILWVVDNSNSMDPLQQNLIQNFNTFIGNFQNQGFDFNMAVTTTDAYLQGPTYNNYPMLAHVRDGVGNFHTGYYYITPLIPNIVTNFVTNADQGATGSGDERAFQSMLDTLNSPLNAGFPRPGAFLAVIILSDEDDFTDYSRPELSWLKGGRADHDYTNPNLMPVDQVIQQLDQLTASTSTRRNYNVSSMTVLDSACQQQHAQQSAVTIVGARYKELAQKTAGILGSICDSSYANSLNFIQKQIINLATEFRLGRIPDPASITVSVNGVLVLQDANNGWTYDSVANAIAFHGTAIPPVSAAIGVNFTPTTIE
jgi:hypothetical protein